MIKLSTINCEPKYVLVDGYFSDDNTEFNNYRIEITMDAEPYEFEYYDPIFYYIGSIQELFNLTKKGIADFIITHAYMQNGEEIDLLN